MKKTDLTKTKKTDFMGLLKAFFGSSDEQENIINSEENTWKNTYSDIIAESTKSIDSLEKMLEQEKTSPGEMVDYSLRKCYEEMRTCSRKVDFNKKFGALDVKKKIKQIEKKIQ